MVETYRITEAFRGQLERIRRPLVVDPFATIDLSLSFTISIVMDQCSSALIEAPAQLQPG